MAIVLCFQVQEEYDSVNRMWRSLPTDAELVERQALTQEEAVSPLLYPPVEYTNQEVLKLEDARNKTPISLPYQ